MTLKCTAEASGIAVSHRVGKVSNEDPEDLNVKYRRTDALSLWYQQ